MDWELLPGGEVVCVRRGGEEQQLPLAVATALWIAGGPSATAHHHRHRAVLLSFGNPAGRRHRISVAITGDPSTDNVPWPEWHPGAPPTWQPCPVGRWVGLPLLGCSETLLRGCAQREETRETAITRDLDDRCHEIRAHGDDDTFTESLDYYTTLRVKLAYLQMNASGIKDRLAEVRKKTRTLWQALGSAPEDWAREWSPPVVDPSTPSPDPCESDPNALCVPQPDDYALRMPGGDLAHHGADAPPTTVDHGGDLADAVQRPA